jgi:CRP-like cAMP-binding protein
MDADEQLLPEGRPVRFQPGEQIFGQGEASDHIAIISAGIVKITAATASGREALLGLRGAGELVGELAAIDGSPRSATVRALDRVQARLVPAVIFRQFLRTHPDALFAVLAAVVVRLRESDRHRLEFVDCDVPERVRLLLAELVRSHGRPESDSGTVRIGLGLSQQDIAGATGASREAVAKALRELRRQGIVTTGRRRITVRDVPRLLG